MELSSYLTGERVVLLKGKTKSEALGELVEIAAAADAKIDKAALLAAIQRREEMMSTGIGQGLGVPHVRLKQASDPIVAVGISRDGIADYTSLDNQPVHIVLLIIAPAGQHEVYIRLLAKAAEVFKDEERRKAIVEADDPAKVYDILTRAE